MYKPCGAGGGDLGMAFAIEAHALESFERAALHLRFSGVCLWSWTSMASPSASKDSGQSRIPNFFKMTIRQRLDALRERDLLSDDDLALLAAGDHTLRIQTADKMIENVIGVLGLPLGVAFNFLINGRDYVAPLCVEEPSIVAGLSAAARTARLSGGLKSSATEAILIGQVQLVDMGHPRSRSTALIAHRDEIISLANSLHPKMVARGGGALDIELFHYTAPEDGRRDGRDAPARRHPRRNGRKSRQHDV